MITFTIANILEIIEAGGELPTLAPVIRRLLTLKENVAKSDADLMEIIRNDVALTTRILRTVNSSGQYEAEAVDIDDAVQRLNGTNLRNLLLATKFIDDTDDSPQGTEEHQRIQWLWERSLCCAVAARILAERLKKPDAGLYHSLGLLLDVGILFLLHNFPREYAPVIDRWRQEGGCLTDMEQDLIGVDHTVVGQQIAHSWHLSPKVECVVRHQDLTGEWTCPDIDRGVIYLANLATSVFFENNNVTGIERTLGFAAEHFNIPREDMVNLLQQITLVADSATMKMVVQAGRAVPYIEMLQRINRELGRATLTYEQMVRELEIAMRKAEQLTKRLEETNQKLRDAANIDPLTRVYNRRYFEEFAGWNFNRAVRYGTTLGCLMIDIDHFKHVNDDYGHLTGDRILQGVAETLRAKLRNTDIVARYGGEEFVVLLPETKPHAVALIAEKLNKSISEVEFPTAEGDIQVTVSVGYVAYSAAGMPEVTSPVELIKIADQNMYQAKHNGRNRIWPPMD